MTKNTLSFAGCGLLALLLTSGCMVGPKYRRPAAPMTPAFKEPLPEGWKLAEPGDGHIPSKWWEMYHDPQLNALEDQVAISNQNVLSFAAQYQEARDAVRIARSNLFPTISVGASASQSLNANTNGNTTSGQHTFYSLPLDVSWEADIWGGIRRGVNAASAQAQATAADLANATLSYQSELAQDYFSLHGVDGEIDLLQTTVQIYRDYLKLTQDRFKAGVVSDSDVAQAESQLESAQSQLTNLGVARAQYEHAIAVLTGKPPAALTIAAMVLKSEPPEVPVALPSALLERRPDIAAQERVVAAANEQIGVAKAAFFPTISLSGSGGFQSSSITSWLNWPSRFFSVGPSLAETLLDAGRRRATLAQYQAAYDATVAAYRQTVLNAFQQVEDALAAERILQEESVTVDQSVKSAQRALDISTAQYKAGTSDYLTVITSQSTLLSAQRTQVDLLTSRLTASVQLFMSIGGGWDTSQMPTAHEVRTAQR